MSSAAVLAKPSRAAPEPKKSTINLRVTETMLGLIDRAAALAGKSRTDFMVESARQHAIDVLLDQQLFQLDAQQHKALMDALEGPPPSVMKLKTLMASKAPWEK